MTKATYRLGNLSAEAVSNHLGNTYLYICPRCGVEWARVVVEGAEWFPLRRPCIAHEWAGMVPGSILTHIEDARFRGPSEHYVSLEGMPPAVLLRELEVHINAVEKGIE